MKHTEQEREREKQQGSEGRVEAGAALPGVLLEVRELAEGFLTEVTVVGLGPRVDADVLGQVGAVGEGFGTMRALVGLGLRVGLGVDLHLRLGVECQ